MNYREARHKMLTGRSGVVTLGALSLSQVSWNASFLMLRREGGGGGGHLNSKGDSYCS